MIPEVVELVTAREQDRARFIAELERAIEVLKLKDTHVTAVAWVLTTSNSFETGCHYGAAGSDTIGLVGALHWAQHDLLRARFLLAEEEEP